MDNIAMNNDLSWNGQASTNASITVDALLDRLISEPDDVESVFFHLFSDLSAGDAQKVRDHWSSVPVARRRMVVEQLIESADEDIDLHLGRFLRVALEDDDVVVRVLAINGLWEEDGADLINQFVQIVQHDISMDARSAAAIALGQYILLGELEEVDTNLAFRAQEALLHILQDESEPIDVRSSALKSIAFSGEAGVRELIEDAYYSGNEEMRLSALIAMGRSADVRWRSFVHAELRNPSADMRTESAIAAGELQMYAAMPDLMNLLGDGARSVRLGAIFALGRLGGSEATNALKIIADEDDEEIAAAAEEALEEMAFFANLEGVPFLEEDQDEGSNVELDPWDSWNDVDDADFGSYE